jgi:PAS domain S-box-containing protein
VSETTDELTPERERVLRAELEAVQQVAAQLISAPRGIQPLYEQVLDTAVALVHADFASIQIFYPERGDGELRLLGYRGFGPEAARRWEWVPPDMCTACGEALRTRRRVVVPDVRTCDFMAGSEDQRTYIAAGILAVQSTPLLSRSGALLGMVSTHWREPREFSRFDANVFDILARFAADLIERSQVEEKLRESEGRFHDMAESTPMMIWTADPQLRCTFVNKAWLDFTGRTRERELGDGWIENVHPDDVESVRATSAAAVKAHRSVEFEYRKRRVDGEYRWVLGSGAPRFAEDGRVMGYVGTCTDITDLKRRREEDAERAKLETVGRLAGGIAHDFNNLLGAVLAQTELALAGRSEAAFPEQELSVIRGVALRGTGIVQQLLIYAGHERAVSTPVQLSELIHEMLDLLTVLVSKRTVLRTELAERLPAVQANPAQLRQVIINLVSNASDAVGEHGGTILIRSANTAPEDEYRAGMSRWVKLEVSDTGAGISPEDQRKIFDPFFTTKSNGHGLGLAVVQRIVTALGGIIEVKSDPGSGATFRIFLPPAGETAAHDSARASSVPDELSCAGVVLLVEDEAPLRSGVAKLLRKNKFRVVEAEDGTAALDLVRGHRDEIGLVLLDLTLPGVPSSEVLAEVRRLRPEIKVVLTSAYGKSKVNELFPGAEIDAFIRKPYQIADLVGLLKRLCVVNPA